MDVSEHREDAAAPMPVLARAHAGRRLLVLPRAGRAAALFCATCGAVQPPGQTDHFARLGLALGYAVDPALLDRRYFERQRLLHPDRFATRTPRERALSQQPGDARSTRPTRR